MKKLLSEILTESNKKSLEESWNSTKAADELKPLPPGEYIARILSGELDTAKTGTLGYKLTFEVAEGEHTGRRFWHDVWLTPAALPMAKRDLARIGVEDLDQLERPLPPGMIVKAKLVVRKDDNGNESNRVKHFEFLRVEQPDAFAPTK